MHDAAVMGCGEHLEDGRGDARPRWGPAALLREGVRRAHARPRAPSRGTRRPRLRHRRGPTRRRDVRLCWRHNSSDRNRLRAAWLSATAGCRTLSAAKAAISMPSRVDARHASHAEQARRGPASAEDMPHLGQCWLLFLVSSDGLLAGSVSALPRTSDISRDYSYTASRHGGRTGAPGESLPRLLV